MTGKSPKQDDQQVGFIEVDDDDAIDKIGVELIDDDGNVISLFTVKAKPGTYEVLHWEELQ
jgi:hypothetical protein